MTYEWGNSLFVLQIFIAELIFLYYYPRRKKFPLRIIAGMAVVIGISGFYPTMTYDYANQIYYFFKYIILFALTVVCMNFCFKAKVPAILSACCAGYALQHLSYQCMRLVSLTSLFADIGGDQLIREHLLELMIFPVTYFLAFLIFGRIGEKNEFYKNYDISFIIVSIFTLFICLVINRFAKQGEYLGYSFVIAGNAMYAIACCLFSLFINFNLHALSITRAKNKTLERISYEERRQYEESKKNREQLNIKYHDLKHVLSLLDRERNAEEIEQYRKIIEDYDSEVRTGNETLDIVINEKVDICRSEDITLTFLGDGKLLEFVSQYDIYSMFGNILDNAIEAVRKIKNSSKRIISVTIESQANCVVISSMNYFEGRLRMTDGNLATTKTDNAESHGFGIRSIKLVAKKYNGEATVRVNNDIFELSVFIVDPETVLQTKKGDKGDKKGKSGKKQKVL